MDATDVSRTSEGIFGQACRYHRPERRRDSDEFTELSKRDREESARAEALSEDLQINILTMQGTDKGYRTYVSFFQIF